MSFGGGGFGGFGQNNNNQQQQAQPSAFGGFGQNNAAANTGTSKSSCSTPPRPVQAIPMMGDVLMKSFPQASVLQTLEAVLAATLAAAAAASSAAATTILAVALAAEVRFHRLDLSQSSRASSTMTKNNAWILTFAGGFGANNNASGAFGAKPAFGAPATTTGSSMFGGTTANNSTTSGFGGFGGNTNTASPSAFGTTTNNTSGGVFGAAKPTGFGASTTGNSLFGGGANTTNTTGGFGASTGFGASNTLGGGGGDPPGTGVTPFQAFTEKEGTGNTSNVFQNICFQDPYKKFSAEELRLVDYAQGRKHGNASGTGAFGVSSGFGGGFGATANNNQGAFGGNTAGNTAGGGLFGGGNNNATTGGAFGSGGTTAFGNTNTTAGGGLFANANKPATGGGLFGNASAQPQQTNSVFGGGNTGGAFGAANNNNTGGAFGQTATNTGGGLFGAANQAKPAGTGFGAFGQAANNNTTGSAFGGGNTTGGAFGATNTTANTGGGLFGGNNNTNTQQAAGGMFGNANNTNTQQNNTNSPFGGFGGQQNQTQQTGGGLFANQNKPATGGLFGAAAPAATNNNAGGGLFGNANNNQQQQTGSAFGQSNSGSLFGAAKPASGGGLFGASTNAQANTSGGLFGGGGLGQNNTQQATSGGLFGAANNNQQKTGGLFGNAGQPSGGSVFGGQNNQTQGSSLFGGANNNQQNQQGSAFGSSLLGNSQQSSNAPQGLTANLNDVSAYGTPALFASLGGNEAPNPGPLATPLNGAAKPRKSSILPMYKLAPASASRFATPQKRGFGFSYSSYGTPGGSPASISSTPSGLGRSLLGSSSSGNLSKSMSTNNLRRTFNSEDSILAPGAFSSSSNTRWYGSTGSKKLVINREIRSDLFTTPQKDKPAAEGNGTNRKLLKRVSFDTSNVDSEETTTPVRALPAPEDSPSTQAEDTPRQPKPAANGAKSPEMEKVSSGNELAIVQEDSNAAAAAVDAHTSSGFENTPGPYWMQPSKDELQSMNRIQRQKVDGFMVGRDNVGVITFKVPVDLSGIDLEEICGDIIQLQPRSATVYPITAKKPPMGKGLNVPARITLEQSWPRAAGREKRISSDPQRFVKHVERLQRIPDTTFENYDQDTGVWVFSVEHFTTYGLDDSDDVDETDVDSQLPGEMEVEVAPQAIAEKPDALSESSRRLFRRSGVPGAFDYQEADEEELPQNQSFLGVSSADLAPSDVRLSLEMEDLSDTGDEYDVSDDEDMARALSGPHQAAELAEASSEDEQDTRRGTPGGILRARMRAIKDSVGPVRLEVADGDDWAEMLRKTVSPVKRDRQELRELNQSPSRNVGGQQDDNLRASAWGRRSIARTDKNDGFAANAALEKTRGFATSIDLMNSLFEKPKPIRDNMRASRSAKGFPQVGTLVTI